MNTNTNILPLPGVHNLLRDCAPTNAIVEFICGTTSDRFGKLLDKDYVESAQVDVEQLLTEAFGGFSCHTVQGGWVNPQGFEVRDKSIVFSCIVPLETDKLLLINLQARIKQAFLQESVPMVVRPCYAQF